MATYYVARVNGDRSDTHASLTVAGAIDLAMADPGSTVEIFSVEADDAGAARLSIECCGRLLSRHVSK